MRVILIFVLMCGLLSADEPKRNWKNSTELAYLGSGGNAETTTFGIKNDYKYTFPKAEFTFKVEGMRASDTTTSRMAFGSVDNFNIQETEDSQVKTERYSVGLKYERKISEKMFWFLGSDWEKDVPKGIKSRTDLTAGLGNHIIKNEETEFKINYGLAYTMRDHFIEPDGFDSSFGSFVLSTILMKKIGERSKLDQVFDYSMPLSETGDFRSKFTNSLTTTISGSLAMKMSLGLFYENKPAFGEMKLYDHEGGSELGTVLYEKDELDYTFTASLVINF